MKISYNIIGLIILLVFTGCTQNQFESSDRLVLQNSYRWNRFNDTDSLYLSKSVDNDTLRFIYKQGHDTLGFSFLKSVLCDSSIFICGISCPLVSTKSYEINEKEFIISKYFYDIESSIDEESSFYYHEKYGLLVCYNDGWNDLIFTMDYDSISKILIDSITNDNTGFMGDIPPPPPESLMHEKDNK